MADRLRLLDAGNCFVTTVHREDSTALDVLRDLIALVDEAGLYCYGGFTLQGQTISIPDGCAAVNECLREPFTDRLRSIRELAGQIHSRSQPRDAFADLHRIGKNVEAAKMLLMESAGAANVI